MPNEEVLRPEVETVIENIVLISNNSLRNVIIEFLTINFYKFLTTDVNILFKFTIYNFLIDEKLKLSSKSTTKIIENISIIEYNTKRLLLDKKFKRYFLHHYRYILNRDIELLLNSVLTDIENRLYRRVDGMLSTTKTRTKTTVVDVDEDEDYGSYYMEKSCMCTCLNKFMCTPIFCPNLLYEKPKQGKKRTYCGSAKIDGSFVNKFIKTIFGFVSAFGFIGLLYLFIRFQHGTKVQIGVSIICALGAVILFGLSFNSTVRAYILLLLPFYATLQGRLILSYIALKTANEKIYGNYGVNLGHLKFALSCMMKIIDEQITQLSNVGGFIGSVFKVVKWLKILAENIGQGIEAMKHLVKEIMGFVQEAFKFVRILLGACNHAFGKPMLLCFDLVRDYESEKCDDLSGGRIILCKTAMVGLRVLCLLTLFLQFYCTILKLLFKGLIFIFKSVTEAVFETLFAGIFGKFSDIFDFSFNASRDYSYFEYQDKSFTQVALDIKQEYHYRFEYVIEIVKTIDYVFPLVILYFIYESWIYRRNYINHIEFDNYVLSVNFEKLDQKRYAKRYRTLLPLRQGLKKHYVPLGSIRKTNKEAKRTRRAICLFFMVLIPILYMVLMDNLMILVYGFVRKHAYVRTDLSEVVPGTSNIGLRIDGTGFMATLYKFLFHAFSEVARANVTIDTLPCLPEVSERNDGAYKYVFILIAVLFLFSVCNPYVLRLRSVILGAVYTRRDEERAIWLYNHIIVKERPFFFTPLMAVREKLRAPTCLDMIWAFIRRILISIYDTIVCILSEIVSFIKQGLNLLAKCPCWAVCCVPFCLVLDILCANCGLPFCLKPCWYVKKLKAFITFFCMKLNSPSCEFCGRQKVGLEFQVCLMSKCQKIYCFDCYSRFSNECPFCILRAKSGDGDDSENSLVYDSSDDEKEEEKLFITTNVNRNDAIEKEKIESDRRMTTAMNIEEISEHKKIYIKALNRIQEKRVHRSILRPRRDIIESIIEERLQPLIELLQSDPKYEYTIVNFKNAILSKKDDLFGPVAIDFYQDLSETIFDNIVKEIEIDEYFSVSKEIRKSNKVYDYLNDIHDEIKKKKI